jgi:hypothetical protein
VLGSGSRVVEIVKQEVGMRRRKLLGVLVGLAVLAGGAFVLWPRTDRLTRENFDRIKEGMSFAQVEAILGPPGDYTTAPELKKKLNLAEYKNCYADRDCLGGVETLDSMDPLACWESDSVQVFISFPQGIVSTKDFFVTSREQQTPAENLLWRAKREWRKWFP